MSLTNFCNTLETMKLFYFNLNTEHELTNQGQLFMFTITTETSS